MRKIERYLTFQKLVFDGEEEDDAVESAASLGDKVVVDREMFKDWFVKLLELDEAMRDRMFIVQLAAENGWKLAKAVALRKSGKSLDEDVQ